VDELVVLGNMRQYQPYNFRAATFNTIGTESRLWIVQQSLHVTMSAARFARTALRASALARPAVQRRGYADVASDKIQLSLTLPHQV